MHFHIGYFEDFKGMNAILISGDGDAIRELANRLRILEDRQAVPMEIHRLPFAEPHGGVKVTAYPVSRELGVRRVEPTRSRPCFVWHHSEQGWLEAAEKIESVADSGVGHNYLECIGVEDATVMVSSGEYDERWWREHG